MSLPACPFCRKLADLSALPAHEVVWQFPHSVAFLGRWQVYQGYCVLVSRPHASELSQLDDATRRAFLDEMCLLAHAIEESFHPQKLNYELLGNQVPHLHWHLFPRYGGGLDPLRPVWFALDEAEKDAETCRLMETGLRPPEVTAATLRQSLSALGAPHA